MVRIAGMIRIVTVLLLLAGLPAAVFGFTPGNFVVSPLSVDVGTIDVPSGETSGPYDFSIAVTGGPIADTAAGESPTYTASTDASWLTLNPANGTVPGNITASVTVAESMAAGTYSGTVTILSGLDPATPPVTTTFTMTVIRSNTGVNDQMIVSPTSIPITTTAGSTDIQTFSISVANADPNSPFTWNAQTDVPWLTLSPMAGSSAGTLTLTFDPQFLPMTDDTMANGATGIITFSSSLSQDTVEITVSVTVATVTGLYVSPGELYWSVEKDSSGGTLSFDPQTVQVFSNQAGWNASCDVTFLTLSTYSSTSAQSQLTVTPNTAALSGLNYGNHTGHIYLSDLVGQFQRTISVTINIRRPGELFSLPVPTPAIYQISPYYAMVEATDASVLNFHLPAPVNLSYFPTAVLCQSAGGVWQDPDNVPGNLNEFCSLDQRVYVLIELKTMAPGLVYAWTKPGQLQPAFNNGVKMPSADTYSYADGPISVVPFGPFQLLGCRGTVIVSMRLGSDLSNAVEIQRLQLNLSSMDGQWKVTEQYNGSTYTYDDANILTLGGIPGQTGYTGVWGTIPVTAQPGDGTTFLYQISFGQNGVTYLYEVLNLTATQMTGRWQFSSAAGTSAWESFSAQRLMWLP